MDDKFHISIGGFILQNYDWEEKKVSKKLPFFAFVKILPNGGRGFGKVSSAELGDKIFKKEKFTQ